MPSEVMEAAAVTTSETPATPIPVEDQSVEQLESTMAAEIEAGKGAAPAVEPVAEPEQTAAEPVASTPSSIPAPDYIFSTLTNGDREVRLATGQVYRGKDDAALMEQVVKAQVEASRHIATLKSTPVSPQVATPPSATPPVPTIDPTAEIIADFTAQGMGFANAKEMRAAFQTLQESVKTTSTATEDYRAQQASLAFIQSTPDFVTTQANIEKLDEGMSILSRIAGLPDGKMLPVTIENIRAAHHLIKGQGLYEAAPANPIPVGSTPSRAANGQFAPRANIMPPPPGANSPQTNLKSTPTENEMWAMPVEEIEKLIRANSAA